VWLSRVKLVSKRTDAIALVEEFATTTLQEIDYLNEADNLERFASDFAADERISTPVVVWERSAKRVLTLSNVASIKIADTESLIAAGIDPNAVAAELARCTFEQFFITGFFHADPHPGNLFIKPNPNGRPGDFTLTYIDFGMMGQIDAEMRNNLQQFLFAVASRDARGWVAACERLGVLLPSADTVVLQDAVEKLFQRFAGVKVTELVQTDPKEIRQFAMQFSEIIRTLPFQLPNDFLFLIRALSLISGVASTLNRDFNIWDAIDPFARTLLKNRQSGLTRGLGQSVFGFLTTAARLPQRLDELARRLERNEVVIRNPELEKRVRSLDSSVRRTTAAIIFAALFVTGFITIEQSELASGLCFGFSVLPFLYAVGVGRLKL
jgi:predicted unusual protein kinase regulating ubiquinone biosynthesis (AarF/ABC1/UbiB family)